MRNYDWKELKRKAHTSRPIMGTEFPDETILEKAIGESCYRVVYHLCNGFPSGSERFKTRWEAEAAFDGA